MSKFHTVVVYAETQLSLIHILGIEEILWPDYDDDYDFDYESYWKEALRKEKIALGGDPDGYNVMVNGECIPFGAVKPEMKNKRLFVPADSLLTAVGAQSSRCLLYTSCTYIQSIAQS